MVSISKGPSTPSTIKPAEPAKPKDPATLGEYLEAQKQTPEQLKAGSTWGLESAARALLKAKGVDSPTPSQMTDTVFQLNEALKTTAWKDFQAPVAGPAIIKAEDGVQQRLGNIFGEKSVFSESDLTADRLKLDPATTKKMTTDFESGRTGMILAATFIGTPQRAEGDFTRAYGDVAWRGFVRANTFLDAIPKGKLLENLSVETICKVNGLMHAPDEGIKATILRGLSFIGRGMRWDKGGELREGRQFGRPEAFTHEQARNLGSLGIKLRELPGGPKDARYCQLEYPEPSQVKPRLKQILEDLKTDLGKPDADPIMAVSRFQQKFVALHPFGDSNGRTGRALMNRILQEVGLPPAILKNQDQDVALSADQFRREVAEGCARTKNFLQKDYSRNSVDAYMGMAGIKVLDASPDKPVTLNGTPFDLGRDGFLYDLSGRPALVLEGKVTPFSQLEYFTFSRRLSAMPKEAAETLLKKITLETVAMHTKVAADPAAGEKVLVEPDNKQREADAEYRLSPHPRVARLLVDVVSVDKLDKVRALAVSGLKGTEVSAAISKHSQHDLELWYLEKGLRDTGQPELADQVRGERGKLFTLAREKIGSLKDEARVSAENPEGFKFKYEQMMYQSSPLRFATLDAAIKQDGDKSVTVWRGDYSFAKLIGMAPNNDVRQKDAKKVASDRFETGAVALLYDDLMKLEGSAMGRQYICTTSDLGLLTRSFADSKKSQSVNLSALPGFIADRILAWAAKEDPRPAPAVGADGKPVAAPVTTEKNPFKEIKDKFGVPGTLLKVRVQELGSKKVEVEANRKAFELKLDKDALLPGIVALGFHHFEGEQEMHGLERVLPWHIKSVHAAETIRAEFKAKELPGKPAAPAEPVVPGEFDVPPPPLPDDVL